MVNARWLRSARSTNHRALVAALGLVLVAGAARAKQIQFVCLENGTCVYECNSDRDCVAVACATGHCDLHTPDGQLCLDDHAFEFCTATTDCPPGKVCNGALCETACSP